MVLGMHTSIKVEIEVEMDSAAEVTKLVDLAEELKAQIMVKSNEAPPKYKATLLLRSSDIPKVVAQLTKLQAMRFDSTSKDVIESLAKDMGIELGIWS